MTRQKSSRGLAKSYPKQPWFAMTVQNNPRCLWIRHSFAKNYPEQKMICTDIAKTLSMVPESAMALQKTFRWHGFATALQKQSKQLLNLQRYCKIACPNTPRFAMALHTQSQRLQNMRWHCKKATHKPTLICSENARAFPSTSEFAMALQKKHPLSKPCFAMALQKHSKASWIGNCIAKSYTRQGLICNGIAKILPTAPEFVTRLQNVPKQTLTCTSITQTLPTANEFAKALLKSYQNQTMICKSFANNSQRQLNV